MILIEFMKLKKSFSNPWSKESIKKELDNYSKSLNLISENRWSANGVISFSLYVLAMRYTY